MFNGNSFREEKHVKAIKKYKSASDLRKLNKKKLLRDYLAQKAEDRKHDWLQAVASSPQFAKHFHEGAIPLVHADLIDFRPQKDQTNAFKNYRYLPEKDRALNMSKSHKQLYFIEGEKYNQKDYNKCPNYRNVDKKKEMQPALKYTYATTKEKVAK